MTVSSRFHMAARFALRALPLILVPLAALAADDHDHALGGPNATFWKSLNLVALIGIAAYALRGKVGPFFAERNKAIAAGISDAATREAEAQKRMDMVEAKLAGLEADIAGLRENAKEEMERDRRRVEADTQAAITRIREHSQREIAAAGMLARGQLRQHAATLAMQLAEQQVMARANEPGMRNGLLEAALRRLARSSEASKN
jgi:F0F1-type ATP synthase membrane subunit b/b'